MAERVGHLRATRFGALTPSHPAEARTAKKHSVARAKEDGEEGGIRTLSDRVDSVSCRIPDAEVAENASDAVVPCTLLHAESVRPLVSPPPRGAVERIQIGGAQPTLFATVDGASRLIAFSGEAVTP